jgi:hypothetical protein
MATAKEKKVSNDGFAIIHLRGVLLILVAALPGPKKGNKYKSVNFNAGR